MALFCPIIRRDLDFLVRFPFCSHIQVFSGEITLYYFFFLLLREFFTSAIADGLSLKSELQPVSTSLQDSSRYSGRFQQYPSLNTLYSSFYFQVLQSLYHSFLDCTKSTNYNWYNCQFQAPLFFHFPNNVEVLILLFALIQFYCVQPGKQSPQFCKFAFVFFYDYHYYNHSSLKGPGHWPNE